MQACITPLWANTTRRACGKDTRHIRNPSPQKTTRSTMMMLSLLLLCSTFLLPVALCYTRSFTMMIESSSTARARIRSWNNQFHHSRRRRWTSTLTTRRPCPWTMKMMIKTTMPIQEYNDFLPRPDPRYSALNVVSMCMETLLSSSKSDGLDVCFGFSNDRCRAAIGGSLVEFQLYAENPTFRHLVHCEAWDIVKVGDLIPAAIPHRGAMQTVLMRAVTRRKPNVVGQSSMAAWANDDTGAGRPDDDDPGKRRRGQQPQEESRLFLWTLQQERRPPRQDCWLVHEVLYVENAYLQTL
jgi:hypothetical protein